MATKERPLGPRQARVLEEINYHGSWHPGYPHWTWGSRSETAAVLESLARRGLVHRITIDPHLNLGVYERLY